jgi:hypothetical protein
MSLTTIRGLWLPNFFISKKTEITMVLIYSKPQKFLFQGMLNDIITQIQNTNSNSKNIIIGGDFNSHHPLWGSETESRKGKEVAELITKHDLVLLNDGSVTRLGTNGQRNTMIDITLVSQNLALSRDWHTHPGSIGSDHLPINTSIQWQNCQLNSSNRTIQQNSKRRKFKQADWAKYIINIGENTKKEISSYDEFKDLLEEGARGSIPSSKATVNPLSSPHPHKTWWTPACDEAKKAQKKALRDFLANGNQYTYLAFKRQTAASTRIIKTAKREGFQKLCSSFSRLTPMTTVWKQVKGFQRGTLRDQCEP